MKTSMFPFPTPEIAVTEIIDYILYVVIIMRRNILAIGRPVLSVGMILKPRCMCIMVLMNVILKNWKILWIMSQQDVQNVIP